MAAAYDIKRHFSGLRVQTARRRGRDPFATGFEDDSEEEGGRKSRQKTKAPPVTKSQPTAPPKPNDVAHTSSSPFANIDALRHDSDDDFLDVPVKKRADRRPSPAPPRGRRGPLPGATYGTDPKKAVILAAGQLAYLDDSSDDEQPVRRTSRSDRRPSPAPRHQNDSIAPSERSHTPGGTSKEQSSVKHNTVVPKHTVASPFAGTKYLQDSDSDGDGEEAVRSRKNSSEGPDEDDSKKYLEVQRVDKPKQNGSGVSWRAFSASRAEQRFAEVEALQASLNQRGRTISFSTHATTDDGQRVPVSPTSERPPACFARGSGRQSRSKSPPRRSADVKPTDDELADGKPYEGPNRIHDPTESKTNPVSGEPARRSNSSDEIGDIERSGAPAAGLPYIRIDDLAQH